MEVIVRSNLLNEENPSLQSTSGRFRFLVPPSGTTCLSPRRICASLAVYRQRLNYLLFPVPTKTLSY